MKLFIFKNDRLHDVLESDNMESCVQYAEEVYGNSEYYWKDTWDYVLGN